MNSKSKNSVRMIAVLGMLSAIAALCAGVFPSGLTVRVGMFIKISPVFFVVAIAGNLYGALGGALVAFLGDLLQALFAGLGFSPLILAVNTLSGLIFGLLLHNTKSMFKISLSVVLTQFLCGLILITLALKIQYGMPVFPTVYWRLLQTIIMSAIEIVVLYFSIRVFKLPEKFKK